MYLVILLAALGAQAFAFGDDDFTMALVGKLLFVILDVMVLFFLIACISKTLTDLRITLIS